ncbi:MAG: CAP domain-containing protein [Bdellovibrionota bacterium]
MTIRLGFFSGVFSTALLFFALSFSPPATAQSYGDSACAEAPSTPLRDICQITNAERAKRRLEPLTWDPSVARVAQAHARDMHVRKYFSHTSPDGRTMSDRLKRGKVPYGWAGENIAAGYQTPVRFMKAWMNSKGHRRNILNSKYTRIGIGWAGEKVVQNFTDGRSRN